MNNRGYYAFSPIFLHAGRGSLQNSFPVLQDPPAKRYRRYQNFSSHPALLQLIGGSLTQQQGTARTSFPFQLCQHMPGVLLWSFCALASPGCSRRQQEGSRAQAVFCSGKTAGSCRSVAGLSVLPAQFHTEGEPTGPSLLTVRKILDLLSI